LVKEKAPDANKVSGIIGSSHFRTTRAEKIDGRPNRKAVFRSTCFFMYDSIAPERELAPTTKSEYPVAVTASSFIIYTSMGTVRMDPPAPIIPSEMPIRVASK
jgi:hypothetical protein